jgi:hypothetical protein
MQRRTLLQLGLVAATAAARPPKGRWPPARRSRQRPRRARRRQDAEHQGDPGGHRRSRQDRRGRRLPARRLSHRLDLPEVRRHPAARQGRDPAGRRELADYPELPTRVAGIELTWPAALINVYKQKNVRIVGDGTIDGDGKVFWDSYWALRRKYDPKGLRWAADYDCKRPRLIQIFDSEEIELAGPRLRRVRLLDGARLLLARRPHRRPGDPQQRSAAAAPAPTASTSTPRTTCWSSGSTWPATTTPCASRPAATPTACGWRARPQHRGPRLRDPRRLGRHHLRQRDLGRLP